MEAHQFDTLLRSMTNNRRLLLGGVAALAAGGLRGAFAGAKLHRKPPRNAFGCVAVGKPCAGENRRCCSGICQGKKPRPGKHDRSRCVAHHSSGCTRQDESCNVVCDPADKKPYYCLVTTGNAPFCGDFSSAPLTDLCRMCRRDADCEEEFGPGAACVVPRDRCLTTCPATGGTACVPPGV